MSFYFILFCICSLVNVMLNTFKTLIMNRFNSKAISCGINAVTYGFYTLVVKQLTGFDDFTAVAVTVGANIIGVYLSMIIMERLQKDKLWKVELTVASKYCDAVNFHLDNIPHNHIDVDDAHTLFNFYCETQQESIRVKAICDEYDAKYFVSETKTL